MKDLSVSPTALNQPNEDEIRDYAFHLYQQDNCMPGHDLENWLEASACLRAKIPADHSRSRLHHHVQGASAGGFNLLATEARILAS